MADINSLEAILKERKKKKGVGVKTEKGAPESTSTKGLTPSQWDILKFVLSGIIIVLLVLLVQLFASYYQVVHDSYLEYTKTIQEYNDTRYNELNIRVRNLENVKTISPTISPQ